MSLKLNLYQLEKRTNSTKNVNDMGLNPIKTVNISIKEGSSILTPTFQLSGVYNQADLEQVNYCELIGDERQDVPILRYYFINDKVIQHGYIELVCEEDYLGTFKFAVKNYYGYCLRSSDESFINRMIPEDLTTVFPKKFIDNNQVVFYPISDITDGSYILGIAGLSFNGLNTDYICQRGSVTYLLMDTNCLTDLISNLQSQSLLNEKENPLQYIVSCVYIPIPISALRGQSASAPDGLVTYSVSILGLADAVSIKFYIASTQIRNTTGVYNLPVRAVFTPPASSATKRFLAYEPYSNYSIVIGGFGNITIPSEYLKRDEFGSMSNIILNYIVDICTGAAILQITADGTINSNNQLVNEKFVDTVTSMVGVNIQLSQISSNNILGTILSSIGQSMATKEVSGQKGLLKYMSDSETRAGSFGSVINTLGQGIKSVGDALTFSHQKVSHIGSTGSIAEFFDNRLHCVTEYIDTVEENLFLNGAPVCMNLRVDQFELNNLIVFENADFKSGLCTKSEQNIINAHLNNGFFYE